MGRKRAVWTCDVLQVIEKAAHFRDFA